MRKHLSLVVSKPKIQNLGELASQIAKLQRQENEAHVDVDLWHAPSECHGDVSRMFDRYWERLDERMQKEHGLSIDDILEEVKRRTSARWVHYHL